MLRAYFGDRAFYRRVLTIAVPIFMQNLITNFVSLLDNLMVGQLGTLPMSGVAIVNQILFIFNLIVFGITTGTGIFTAQFFGRGDNEGVRHTFRFKVLASILLTLGCITVLSLWDAGLIRMFLQGDGTAADAAGMLRFGEEYLQIMLWGLVPFAISSAYATTLREGGETVVPMISSFAAMFCNLILNYILIFGHLGAPAMGAKGAAVATVISRYLEFAIVVLWAHRNTGKYPFVRGLYRSLRIPMKLVRQMLAKVLPLVANEGIWAAAVAFQTQCYTTCGLHVISAVNIVTTLNSMIIVINVATGNTVGILMGQMLGANRTKEEIRGENRKLITFATLCGAAFALLMMAMAPIFPRFYNTTQDVWTMSTSMILLLALSKPFQSHHMSVYYTIRAGGLVYTTMLYDSGYLCAITLPLTFLLCHYSGLPFVVIYGLCQLPEALKTVFGAILLRRDGWIRNLTVS